MFLQKYLNFLGKSWRLFSKNLQIFEKKNLLELHCSKKSLEEFLEKNSEKKLKNLREKLLEKF